MKYASFFLSIILILTASGCAKLKHLTQLLTLKEMAEEYDDISQDVEALEASFEKMLGEIKAGKDLKDYQTAEIFKDQFGEPVLSKSIIVDEKAQVRWLYRWPTKLIGSEKVYIYLNDDGEILRWEFIPAND